MAKRSRRPKRPWIVLIIFTVIILLYLNRSYAYFFDYLGDHEIEPPEISAPFVNYILPAKSIAPRDPLRYYALGDSLTRGVGVKSNLEAYPYLLADNLSKNRNIDYTNLAVPGARSLDLLLLQVPQVKNVDADYISVMVGINDVLNHVNKDTFSKNYAEILNQLAKDNTRLIVLNIPYLIGDTMLPPYNTLYEWRIKEFNSIINNLIEDKRQSGTDIIFIDLYDSTQIQFQSDKSNFSEDKFHPSSKGYAFWGKLINDDTDF